MIKGYKKATLREWKDKYSALLICEQKYDKLVNQPKVLARVLANEALKNLISV